MLDLLKLKVSEDEKFIVAQTVEFSFGEVENTVEKGENTGN